MTPALAAVAAAGVAAGRRPMTRLALLLALLPAAAWAVPPEPGTPAAEELSRLTTREQEWIANQHDMAGRWCCSLGDFDFVDLDASGDTLRARARHPDPAKGIPSGWLDVPPETHADLHGETDVPDVVAAWYYQGRIQCIIVGSG